MTDIVNRRSASMAALVVVVALASGCGSSGSLMLRAASPTVATPPLGQALVVFIRPGAYAGNCRFRLVDQNGNFVGASLARTHFSVQLPPGEHMIFALAENVAPLHLTVEAGRTYYVRVQAVMGGFAAHARLLPLTPRSAEWSQRDLWINETSGLDTNLAVARAYASRRAAEIQGVITRGLRTWQGLTPEEQEIFTLHSGDGV